jgi:hypothetical protein
VRAVMWDPIPRRKAQAVNGMILDKRFGGNGKCQRPGLIGK